MITPAHYLYYIHIINLVSIEPMKSIIAVEIPAILPSRKEAIGDTAISEESIVHVRSDARSPAVEAIFQSSDALSSATIANDKQIVLSRLRLNRA